jgi:hypothetical protein
MNLLVLTAALLPWAGSARAVFTRLFVAVSVFSVEMQLATVTGRATLGSLVAVNVAVAAALVAWQWWRRGRPFAAWNAALLPHVPWPLVGAAAALVLVLNLVLPLQAADPYHLERVAQIERSGTLEYDPAAEPKINLVNWLYELWLADIRQIPGAGPTLVRMHGILELMLLLAGLAAAQSWLGPWRRRWPVALLLVIPPLFHELVLIKNDLFLAVPAFVALVWLATAPHHASWQQAAWAGWLIGIAVVGKPITAPLAMVAIAGIAASQRSAAVRPLAGLAFGGVLGAVSGGLFFSMYANAGLYGDPLATAEVEALGNVTRGIAESIVSIWRFVISLVDMGLVTRVVWPGRGGWGGTFGLPLLWALAMLIVHYRVREARWTLWIVVPLLVSFAAVFPDADLAHRIVLAPALVAVVVAVHLLDTREPYRRPASIALAAVMMLSTAQLLRSALLYLTAT